MGGKTLQWREKGVLLQNNFKNRAAKKWVAAAPRSKEGKSEFLMDEEREQ